MRSEPGPGPATADRGRTGPFAALVSRATQDAEATLALVMAYDATPAVARADFVQAVESDARAEGVGAAAVLLGLLSVEEDPSAAALIAEALDRCDPSTLIPPSQEAQLMLEGDEDRGTLVVTRPLHGLFVELLELSWEGGAVTARHEPLTVRRAAGARSQERGRAVSVDELAELLWALRRRTGTLPAAAARLADLLDSPAKL